MQSHVRYFTFPRTETYAVILQNSRAPQFSALLDNLSLEHPFNERNAAA